jgi:hypothetical protein
MKRLIVLLIVVGLLGFYAGSLKVSAAQPHMQAAMEHLKAAKAELEQAEHDKGGHREAALKATEEAIHHVHEGIEYGAHKH